MTNSIIEISEVRVQLLCLVSYVRISLRYSNLHDMTNSIIEISELRVQLLCLVPYVRISLS